MKNNNYRIVVQCMKDKKRNIYKFKACIDKSDNEWFCIRKIRGYCTKNVANFIAVVHTIYYCRQNNIDLPIYTNNVDAYKWIKNKESDFVLFEKEDNRAVINEYNNALVWLQKNEITNQVLYWDKTMGDIGKPFYFHRKENTKTKRR